MAQSTSLPVLTSFQRSLQRSLNERDLNVNTIEEDNFKLSITKEALQVSNKRRQLVVEHGKAGPQAARS